MRKLIIVCALLIGWITAGHTQSEWCPPPAQFVPGGGGLMCVCPDGTPYGLGGSCGSRQPQYSQPNDGRVWCSAESWCQADTTCCGNQCCHAGFYCSKYGCTPQGAIECGNHYCNSGQQCARSGGCQPTGSVDCGQYYCQRGEKCGNGWRACLAEGAVDCGSTHKTSCQAGRTCWVAPADVGTLKKGQLYCPTSEETASLQQQISEQARQKEKERLAQSARKKQDAEANRQAEIV